MQVVRELRDTLLHGVVPAMATPLAADGHSVELAGLPGIIDFLINAGVKGIFVGGSTGEGILFSRSERMKLHAKATEHNQGRIPLLLHVGANQLNEAVALAEHATALKPAGLVALTPIFYGIHDDAILHYFQTIAAINPEIPFFAYDMPHMSINGVSPALLRRITATIPNFAGIKSSRHNAQMVRELIHNSAEHHCILVGNERVALGNLAMGASGMISGLSTALPEPFVALTRAVGEGNLAEARRQHGIINRILDLTPAGTRIGFIKTILNQRGVPVGDPVAPRPNPPAGDYWAQAKAIMDGN